MHPSAAQPTAEQPRAAAPSGSEPRRLISLGVGCAAWLLAIFCAAPSLHDFSAARVEFMRSGDFLKLCANPFARDLHEPLLAYRIFPPALGWLLGAQRWVCLALPYLATITMLACVAHAVGRRIGAKLGAWAALLVAGSYAVTWPNCLLGYADGFAHLAAAVLLLATNRAAIAAVVTAGILSDERFVFALPFVALWHGATWMKKSAVAIGAGVAMAVLVRLALRDGWLGPGIAPVQVYANIWTTLGSGRPWDMSWGEWLANVAASYRWAWVFLGIALWRVRSVGRAREAAIAALAVGAGVASSFVVFDVARSVAFTWLVLPLAFVWLAEHRADAALRAVRVVAIACFLTPSVWIVPGAVLWWRPLLVRAFTYFTGQ